MKGQVFTIAKLHYINGVVYHVEQSGAAKIDEIADHYSETTKSGKAKHPKVRVRTLARFADGIGLIKFIDKSTVTLTHLGHEYCRSKANDKWSLSESQKALLRDHILENPSRTKTTFAIHSLLNLVSIGLKGTDLTQKYAEAIGKQDRWKSTATFDGFTEFGLNYLQELGFIDTAGDLIRELVPSIKTDLGFNHGLRAGETLRNEQLTSIFKCSPQGGMRRSRRTNTLVIISDHTKSIYEDRWVADDVIHYTGMGLEGDQSLEYAQNKTLAESNTSGVIPFLFEVYKEGKYLFRGQVTLADEPYQETQPDKNDHIRNVWIFPLRVVGDDATYEVPDALITEKQQLKERIARRLSDEELHKRAIHSRKQPVNRKVASTTYERNAYVAELARRRANGICQLCDQPAPFLNKSGEPYLESHHIVWLSRGGEDTVENTVALCPNCHKKMHILNTRSDRKKLEDEAKKICCQLTFTGETIFV